MMNTPYEVDLINLTFGEPYNVIYFYNKTN